MVTARADVLLPAVVLVLSCASSVSATGDVSGSTDVLLSDEDRDAPDVTRDAVEAPLPSDLGVPRCTNPDYPEQGWKAGSCACIGARPGRPGICRTGVTELGPSCRAGACPYLLEGAPTYCVALDLDQPLHFECADGDFCRALAALDLRTPAYPRNAACVYGDGTLFRAGVVGSASCPAGSDGLLCGVGCERCPLTHGLCWGMSEANPLGACLRVQETTNSSCTSAAQCSAGDGCLLILDAARGPTASVCVEAERCARVASLAVERFACR